MTPSSVPPTPPPPDAPVDADGDDAATRYAYKPSLLGNAYAFELTPGGLSWRAGRRGGFWAYDDIAMVRMSYRPVSMQTRRYRTDLWSRSGQHAIAVSTTWRSIALVEPQDDSYRAFIGELHRRIGAAGGRVLCEGGLLPWVYHLATLVLGLMAVAMIGLVVRALTTGSMSGALFLAALMALFAWQIGTFMHRNRPIRYLPEAPPAHLLP